jgi:predicted TIM-barrel fold metal-dependent hydrolase
VDGFPHWIISVDDHVLEPGHVWQERVPAKLRDRAPKLIQHEKFGTSWEFDGMLLPTSGMAAAATIEGDMSPNPLDYSELRPGCTEPKARVADMDRDHVLASLCFPSFPRFAGQLFSLIDDKELGLACIRAYNDWMIEEWAGTVPGRLIPLVVMPFWDPKLATAEVQRCAAAGAAAVAFSENSDKLGFPSIHDADYYWDPVFAACAEAGLPVCMHMGSSSLLPQTAADAPYIVSISLGPTSIIYCLNDWLFSGQFQRHPDLKICLSEGGIGWIPYALERASYVVRKNRVWLDKIDDEGLDEAAAWVGGTKKGARSEGYDIPVRELFRRHVYGCFIDDEFGCRNVHDVGVDNVMLETDYPHADSTWPNSWPLAKERLAGLTDEEVYKIVQGNARKVFGTFAFADEPAPVAV